MAEGLLALPQELWIQVMSNLDAISLAHCAMTCKLLYETLQGSSQLEYIVQLYLHGFKDAQTSTPHSEIIQRLLHYRKVWLSLPRNKELEYTAVDMKQECLAHGLAGGAFAVSDKQHFEIVQLPTTYSDGENPTLRTVSIGIPIREFAMDPTQDLIVFLEDDTTLALPTATRIARVHIRTISTNATHPLARQSPLQFIIPPNLYYHRNVHYTLLQLACNTLALHFSSTGPQNQPRVHIWDWTTSDLLVDSSIPFDSLLPPSPYGIDLLDSTRCFVTSQAGSGSIRLYSLLQSPSTTSAPIHVATLHLPPTSPGTVISAMSAHAGSIEANPEPHMPYMIHEEDRLHVLKLVYDMHTTFDNTLRESLNLFVHQRVFTKYYVRGLQLRDDDPVAPALDVPWSEWGPQNTYADSPAVMHHSWQNAIHGQRVIYLARIDGYSCSVGIFDFSRAAAQTACATRDPSMWAMPWNTLHPGDHAYLAAKVPTYLPFASSTVACEFNHSMFMIYADGIVGFTIKDNGSLLLNVYPISQEEEYPETWDDKSTMALGSSNINDWYY